MATSNVIRLPPRPERESLSQIHAQLMAAHEALHCATVVLGRIEAGDDPADFGPALRLVERSAAQLDRLDEWHVAHHRELPPGA
jgi:hypothetical protein